MGMWHTRLLLRGWISTTSIPLTISCWDRSTGLWTTVHLSSGVFWPSFNNSEHNIEIPQAKYSGKQADFFKPKLLFASPTNSDQKDASKDHICKIEDPGTPRIKVSKTLFHEVADDEYTHKVPLGEKEVTCNCKNSKCLKLYCHCFRAGQYCSGCACVMCRNTKEYEEERRKVIISITQRNPMAFKPRVDKVSDIVRI